MTTTPDDVATASTAFAMEQAQAATEYRTRVNQAEEVFKSVLAEAIADGHRWTTIATRLGIARTTLYRYFNDMEMAKLRLERAKRKNAQYDAAREEGHDGER